MSRLIACLASIVLHDSEPLLAGPVRLEVIILALREGLAGRCDLDLRIHTNGILGSTSISAVFQNH